MDVESGIKDRFALEDICEAHEHTVIRLTPYHCHLNPIEIAWAGIKSYIRNEVATKATEGEKKIKEAVDSITQERWHKYCQHVKKEAAKLVENELIAEDIQDPIIIDLEADSDSDTDDTNTECGSEAAGGRTWNWTAKTCVQLVYTEMI